MKKTNYLKLVVNFVPIILLFLLVTYTPEFVKFSHTILGKAFAVILILFYVSLDIILGLFVCALVIFYYQTDYVESFNNMLNEDFTEKLEGEEKEKNESEEIGENEESEKSEKNKDKDNIEQIKKVKKVETPIETTESFETLEDAYPLAPTTEISYDKSVDNFRKEHCKKGHLINKGQIVKPEMAQHVYPIIQENNFKKCNICDPLCDFQINDKRIIDEANLTTPKSSNDMFEKVWINLRTTTEPTNYES
jgi:hypothetical protein